MVRRAFVGDEDRKRERRATTSPRARCKDVRVAGVDEAALKLLFNRGVRAGNDTGKRDEFRRRGSCR